LETIFILINKKLAELVSIIDCYKVLTNDDSLD